MSNVTFYLHPKESPQVFAIIRIATSAVTIPLSAMAVYIVKKSPSVTRVYANLLVGLLIGSVFFDIFMQWVFNPAFLIPPFCMYRKAPLLMPVSARFCAGLLMSLAGVGGQAYFALFVYRHQAITLPGSRFKFSNRAIIAVITICLIPCIALGPSFYIGRVSITEYAGHGTLREYCLTEEWTSAVAERLDCFITIEPIMFPYFALIIIIPTFTGLIIVAVARHTFLLLREVKHISAKTQNLHRILTRSLVVQALVPVLVVIVPFAITALVAAFGAFFDPQGAINWAVDPLDFLILAISFHATVHSIALVGTTPTFREKLFEMFFGHNNSASVAESRASNSVFTKY